MKTLGDFATSLVIGITLVSCILLCQQGCVMAAREIGAQGERAVQRSYDIQMEYNRNQLQRLRRPPAEEQELRG